MRSLSRIPRYPRRRSILQALVLFFILYTTFEISQILRCLSNPPPGGPIPLYPRRVYIASIHWNNEAILRSRWNDAVVALALALGQENVFVSVHESGSWDDSKGALKELDAKLREHKIRRNITLSDVTHADEISVEDKGSGWIDTPRGNRELRRIPYLSRLRNLSLEPLRRLQLQGEQFDTVLFLNDVVFTTTDALRLLSTNNGDFAAACSLDFNRPPLFYDTFALRDAEGHEMLMQKWPYFQARESRRAILANVPVPVSSCWNGMGYLLSYATVAMPAQPFISDPPLRFRGIPDSLAASHLEGSECCLIHADNPLSAEKRVLVNPNVRVGYSGEAYDAVHPQRSLQSFWQIFGALWENRLRRWTTTVSFKEMYVRRQIARWKKGNRHREERGNSCLVNEMQVLAENGWAHV
ncbi:hypothetical protein N0V90_013529 [Kalmusia sp. IMI 367209]|nr:hypothetical protein N0V90_013529 [Kalmusia sp. IMI 367209]